MKHTHIFLKALSGSQSESRFHQTTKNEMRALGLVWLELISLLNSKFQVSPTEAEGLLKKTPQISYNSRGNFFFSIFHSTSLPGRLNKNEITFPENVVVIIVPVPAICVNTGWFGRVF